MKRGFRSEVVVGLAVLVIFVLGAIFFTDVPPIERIQSLRTWQDSDAPAGYPVEVDEARPDGRIPSFDGQFVLLDGFERFRLPPVSQLDHPLGSADGALTYNAQPFLEMNDQMKARHLGDDLNGIGGMNTDQGDPVFAVGNGVVGYAADRGGAWGKVVVIGHRLADGRILHSLYGHLEEIDVARGALVSRGQRVGTVGTAHESWLAHLHFELYEGPLLDPGPGYAQGALNRLDPAATLAAHQRSAPADLAPEALAVYEAEAQIFKIGAGGMPVPVEE